MTLQEDIIKLSDALAKCAEVYRSQVLDPAFDNGLLDHINNSVKEIELALKTLIDRRP